MYNTSVLLVGVGGFGVRHFQSLAPESLIQLMACDLSADALSDAKRSVGECIDCTFFRSLNEIDEGSHFSWAIIATDARNRLGVAKSALRRFNIDNLLLEKIVFNRLNDYKEFDEIIKTEYFGNIFVNFPRRTYKKYLILKNVLSKCKKINIVVRGNNIGLGCNGLHFIDLFEFLTGCAVDTISIDIAGEVFPAKRNGYIDFDGMIRCSSLAGALLIESSYESDAVGPTTIEIICDGCHCLYSERSGLIDCDEFFDGWIDRGENIVVNQSDLTSSLVLDSSYGNVLPHYSDAAKTHMMFIESVCNAFNCIDLLVENEVPIT